MKRWRRGMTLKLPQLEASTGAEAGRVSLAVPLVMCDTSCLTHELSPQDDTALSNANSPGCISYWLFGWTGSASIGQVSSGTLRVPLGLDFFVQKRQKPCVGLLHSNVEGRSCVYQKCIVVGGIVCQVRGLAESLFPTRSGDTELKNTTYLLSKSI